LTAIFPNGFSCNTFRSVCMILLSDHFNETMLIVWFNGQVCMSPKFPKGGILR
jgi:hypothetical protein